MTQNKIITFTTLILSVVIVAVLFTQYPQSAPAMTINTIDGKEIHLTGQSPGPILVHFWSTTCGICIEEMPAMNTLFHDLKSKGFNIIGVAQSHSPPNTVLDFIDKLEIPFPVALDINNEISRAFGPIEATPTSILLSQQGKILLNQVGGGHLTELENALKNLFQNINDAG